MPTNADQTGWSRSEAEQLIADAAPYLGCTAEERWAAFVSIQKMIAATWSGLTEEEMARRLRIGELLSPRPEPWWKNIRPEVRP